uniref:Secreted protein n=1 Tax=Amphimedon queenslandica TaxID=400682 RepID=A0A1X7UUN0_AMPQE
MFKTCYYHYFLLLSSLTVVGKGWEPSMNDRRVPHVTSCNSFNCKKKEKTNVISHRTAVECNNLPRYLMYMAEASFGP